MQMVEGQHLCHPERDEKKKKSLILLICFLCEPQYITWMSFKWGLRECVRLRKMPLGTFVVSVLFS